MVIKKAQIKTILQALAGGCSITDACAVARVSREWFHSTLKKNKKFAEDVEYAAAVCKQRNIARIQNASTKHWQAAAWWMERKHPEEYAFTTKHDVAEGKDLSALLALAFKRKAGARPK